MRILLINPLSRSLHRGDVPPLGLAYLTSVLLRHNYNVRILDMEVPLFSDIQMVKRSIESFCPDLIGVTSKTYGFSKTLDVIRAARLAEPNAPIVIGGPHATIMRDKLLHDIPELSFVVYGEGESTLLELCNAVDSSSVFSGVKGLVWRKDDSIVTNSPRPFNRDLDGLPFASESFDVFGFRKYYDSSRTLILTSRGCPYGCIYCSVPDLCGRRFRPRSPENVLQEIEFIHRRYGTKHFHFTDDNFSFDLARAKRICDEISERRLDITWDTPNGIRADRVDEELLHKMKKAGCETVWYGLESANQEIVDALRKSIKVDVVKRAINWSKNCGLKVGVFFVVGSPGESLDTVKQSVDLALSMDVESIFSMLTPYPGTKLWDWVSDNARWTQDPYEYLYFHGHIDKASVPFETDDFSKAEREKAWRFIQRTVVRKRRQREYEESLRRVLPSFADNTILQTASRALSMLWGNPLLNLMFRSKTLFQLRSRMLRKVQND